MLLLSNLCIYIICKEYIQLYEKELIYTIYINVKLNK